MSQLDKIKLDPADIKEVIETDSLKSTILTKEATERLMEAYKNEMDNGHTITVEGEEICLLGYRELHPRDGPRDAIVYMKLVPEKAQIQFAVANHPDMENTHNKIEPLLLNLATMSGLTLINIRTVMTEAIGNIKRVKGVTSLGESEGITCCYDCLKASGKKTCEYQDAGEPDKCKRYSEAV